MTAADAAGTGIIRRLRSSAAPLAKTTLLRAGGYAALRRLAPSRALAILRYHAVCGPEGAAYADPQICISPEAFDAHVRYLSEHYTVIGLPEAVSRMRAGRPLPRNAVAITFDDGYADNLPAARTLARYGATATFYITAGCLAEGEPFWPAEVRHLVHSVPGRAIVVTVERAQIEIGIDSEPARVAAVRRLTKLFKSNPIPVRERLRAELREQAMAPPRLAARVMLTWDEVREMHALGMTIGSHTMTHPNLPSAGTADASRELRESKYRLEEEIGTPVTMFSYPNGGAERYVTPDVRQAVIDAGYAAASTSRNGFARAGSDLYQLERIEVEERLEDLVFALEVERFAFGPE